MFINREIQGFIATMLLFAALYWSRTILAKAGMQLQEKERKQANELLGTSMRMIIVLTIVYGCCMMLAGWYFNQYIRWIAIFIHAVYLTLFALVNHRLYERFFDLGYPNAFSNQFIQSRVILLLGIMVYASYLLSMMHSFNKF